MVTTPFLDRLVPGLGRPKQLTTNWLPPMPVNSVGDVFGGGLDLAKRYGRSVLTANDVQDLRPTLIPTAITPSPQRPAPSPAVAPTAQPPVQTPNTPRPATGNWQGPIIGDNNRVTQWDLDDKYLVVRTLGNNREAFFKPFESGDPDQIIADTTQTVIDVMGQNGYTITPEFEKWFKDVSGDATREWIDGLKATGKRNLSATEYYVFLTDFAITGYEGLPEVSSESTPTTAESSAPGGWTADLLQNTYTQWAERNLQIDPNADVSVSAFAKAMDIDPKIAAAWEGKE